MNEKNIHIAGFFLIFTVVAVATTSPEQESVYLASGFGFLALLSVIFILAIPLAAKYARSPLTAYLMANRRWIGIYSFIFALLHVLIVYNSFFGWDVSKIVNNPGAPFLAMGSLAFLILASMTATSNDASVRVLGRNWKRLHLLVYAVVALILVHAYNLGAVFMSNRIIATFTIVAATIVVALRMRAKLAAQRSVPPEQPL